MRSIPILILIVASLCAVRAAAESEVITLGKSTQQIVYQGPTPLDAPGTIHVTLGACSFDSSADMTNCVFSGPAAESSGDITGYQFVQSYAGNGPSPMTGTLNPDGTFTAHANGLVSESEFFGDADDPENFFLKFGDVEGEAQDENHKTWFFVMNTISPGPADVALVNCHGLGSLPCDLFDVAKTPGSELDTFVFSGTVTPSPEPANLLLLGSGIVALFGLRRKLR